ncbi:hypothetical protein EAE93_05505 [Photorhabdus akhurstii]|nr:hypothetical protein KS18_12770 [Photorhabdus luminescens]MBS9427554.1 hypothetical protein [Photorhabdus akhurstii]
MINRSKKYRCESAAGLMVYEIGSFVQQNRGTVTILNCRFARIELQQDVQLLPIAALYHDN